LELIGVKFLLLELAVDLVEEVQTKLPIQKNKGLRKAVLAVARRMAIILHKMLITGKEFWAWFKFG